MPILLKGATDGNTHDAKPDDGESEVVDRGMNAVEGRGGKKEDEERCDELEDALGTGTRYPICAAAPQVGGLKALPPPGAGTAIFG